MKILQMSFAGAVLVTAIVIIRALAINNLPKRVFLALWGIVLIRLVVPFTLPSIYSAYALMERHTPVICGGRSAEFPSKKYGGGAER